MTGLLFISSWCSSKYLQKRCVQENRFRVVAVRCCLRPQLPGKQSRLIQAKRTIDECQSLLRNNAFGSTITFVGVCRVEQHQHSHLFFVRVAKINTAASSRFALTKIDVRASQFQINLTRYSQHVVPDRFRVEAAGWACQKYLLSGSISRFRGAWADLEDETCRQVCDKTIKR